MRFSAPVYRLKRHARILSRREKIPYYEALDRIARAEGFDSWSLLASRVSEHRPGKRLGTELEPGDLVLVGARPGHGKTLLSLEIAIEAMRAGRRSAFFSLECGRIDVVRYFSTIGEDLRRYEDRFDFDDSDDICAEYMVRELASASPGTVVVVDYLQLLDQKRVNPPLTEQIETLRVFARERGLIIVFVSQINRSFDSAAKPIPEIADVRRPNPLDLTVFSKTCFLHDGQVEFAATLS